MKDHYLIFTIIAVIALPSSAAADEGPFINRTDGRETEPHKWLSDDMIVSETIRIVTAYNAGDPAQNYGNPCISASGENLCKALSAGKKRCAANFVPLGTELHIEKYGIFVVSDRTNRRYRNRVDIAMKLDEIQKAKQFGKQRLNVKVLKSRKATPPKDSPRLAISTR